MTKYTTEDVTALLGELKQTRRDLENAMKLIRDIRNDSFVTPKIQWVWKADEFLRNTGNKEAPHD